MYKIKVLITILLVILATTSCAYGPPQASIPVEAIVQQEDKNTKNNNFISKDDLEIQEYIKAVKESRYSIKLDKNDMLLYNPKILKLSLMDFDPLTIFKKAGYYKVESNDENLNFRNAVIRFQSSINEPVSGALTELDSQIIETSILSLILENKFNILPVSTDKINTSPTDSFWIAINKTTRILTLYEGNKTIKKYPVAPGKNPAYTPEGKFSIVIMAKNPSWGGGGYASPVAGGSSHNPLGYRWMGLSPKGGSVYGIHGNNSPYSIGTNASHGCIRMINSDVEELFDIIPIDTVVWIGTADMLNEWGVSQEMYHI